MLLEVDINSIQIFNYLQPMNNQYFFVFMTIKSWKLVVFLIISSGIISF